VIWLLPLTWSVEGSGQEGSSDSASTTAVAIFAGGCFWCMEPPFDQLDGVLATTSGYTGGHVEHPTYVQVSSGDTGHYEAVRISYDPYLISYGELLDVFWVNVDPLDAGGQFCDRGNQYRSAIFYRDDGERSEAIRSKSRAEALLSQSGRTGSIETQVLSAEPFFEAEAYHQNYYEENPIRYGFYRFTCGRDSRLAEVWGDLSSLPADASATPREAK
jgi:peptide-methionine (S)-S-oxide reductase